MNATCCPKHDTLEAYLLGTLDDAAIDAHLEDCVHCQAALDELDGAVNRPFACLREPAAVVADWQQPAYQHLVAQAKGLAASALTGDSPEQTIGSYRLLELLARGMNPVYKAHHQHLKKTVALKLLHWPHRSVESRQRFRREMEAVGRLASPHIVTALDAGEAGGVDFLAMEFIEGDNFSVLVRKQGPLPVAQALDCILQAARGLADAHSAGIIHRDVKPSNLLLDTTGTVKVLDLGLARLYTEDADAGAVMGTPAYMAPEQWSGVNQVDERTDVYGLGCTLHFLLTGKAPFATDTVVELMHAHRDGPIPSLCAARPDCPRAVDGLFRRMIAKIPQDRPASMRDVIAEVERLLKPVPVRRPVGWRGLIAASVAVAACALVAFAFWSGREPMKEDTPKKSVAVVPKEGVKPVIEMARIAPGEFWMGASETDKAAHDSEKPRRKVKLNRAFFLGKTEVTQSQYKEVMGTNPSAFRADGPAKARVKDLDTSEHPVESVSWLDAVRYANRLSERHELEPYYKIAGEVVTINGGVGYRLPTEAEWEYACRAGAKTTWSFGEDPADMKEHAWFAGNSDDRTHRVGKKKANVWGLYDMYGNVPEWCWDRYAADYYKDMPASDPPGSGKGRERVFRGDAWNSVLPRTSARPALGFTYGSSGSINIIGFRLARNAEP